MHKGPKLKGPVSGGSILKLPQRTAEAFKNGFTVNFSHLDHKNQGATASEIEDIKQLSHLVEIFHGFGAFHIHDMESRLGHRKFCVYGDFPEKGTTEYTHPKHVPEDAKWARIHVTGKYCAIGHVDGDIFYLVFLDKDHKFWKTELKHT